MLFVRRERCVRAGSVTCTSVNKNGSVPGERVPDSASVGGCVGCSGV